MNKLVKFLFYSLLAIIYFASYWKDQTNYLKKAFAEIGLDYHTSFGGRMKYLTYIDLVYLFFVFKKTFFLLFIIFYIRIFKPFTTLFAL